MNEFTFWKVNDTIVGSQVGRISLYYSFYYFLLIRARLFFEFSGPNYYLIRNRQIYMLGYILFKEFIYINTKCTILELSTAKQLEFDH